MSDASTRRVRQDHLVTLTLPAGWLARPPHLSGDDGGVDVDHALAVVEAHELAVLPIPSDTTRDHVLGEMRLPGTDLDASLLVFDERGRAEGYLILELDDALNTIFCNAYVDPASLPEYPSLINELIDHALEYGRHIAIDRHNSWEIACAAYAEDTSYGDALTRAGFEAVRHFFRMRIDLVENPPAEPAPWPAGGHRSSTTGSLGSCRSIVRRPLARGLAALRRMACAHDRRQRVPRSRPVVARARRRHTRGIPCRRPFPRASRRRVRRRGGSET